jgi:hypothetical protein
MAALFWRIRRDGYRETIPGTDEEALSRAAIRVPLDPSTARDPRAFTQTRTYRSSATIDRSSAR